jgi:DNA-binding MarR family transcriptional regulator
VTLQEVQRLLESIAAIHTEMPLQQARCLFIVAESEEGMSLSDIAKKAGIGLATASRYIGALGKVNRKREEGLQLIESFEDPMERRKKVIRLTTKGRAAVRRIIGD